jgi:kinetochore protein Mis13/DSN1
VNTAYDEEDNGFMFTRVSKKSKTASTEPEPAPASDPASKKTNKRKARDEEPAATVKKGRGRKMSFSTPKADNDNISVPKKSKGARLSTGKVQNGESSTNQNAPEITDFDSIDMVGVSKTDETTKSIPEPEAEVSKNATMISLPFSDTPIINRNKELRKKGVGTRRSSLGLRGRRASSLIDNGHSAIPHREVETTEFYKHIEAEGLSEPRRMKQLLTWTGERALGEKPSHGDPDSAAALAGEDIGLCRHVLN